MYLEKRVSALEECVGTKKDAPDDGIASILSYITDRSDYDWTDYVARVNHLDTEITITIKRRN